MSNLNEIRDASNSLINNAYKVGYDTGYKEATEDEKAYEKGLEDAWEFARTICTTDIRVLENMGFIINKDSRNDEYMASAKVIEEYSVDDAIERITDYEERKQKNRKDFKVGDEIIRNNDNYNRFVIISINDEDVYTINQNGGHGYMKINILYENYQKTGRSFPQIAEVVKQLKENI